MFIYSSFHDIESIFRHMSGIHQEAECLALNLAGKNISGGNLKLNEGKNEGQTKVIAGVELAEETIEEIKEAFLEFDIDSDGTITTKGCNPNSHMVKLSQPLCWAQGCPLWPS